MTETARIFTASFKMLIRDKTAFVMAVVFPLIFVVTFSLFDVGFTGEGAIAGVEYFDYVLPGLLAIGLMNFAMVGAAASVARYREAQDPQAHPRHSAGPIEVHRRPGGGAPRACDGADRNHHGRRGCTRRLTR